MAKNLKDILGGYTPKPEGEKQFVAKHSVKKTADANKNGDDVFNASKVKTVNRASERHGYDAGQDEKVYEETMTAADKKKEKAIKAKTDKSGMKASMQKQYGAEKGKQVYFATIRKHAMESVEIEEGLKYAQVEPKDVKAVLAAHRATGESARHMGGGKIAYSGKKLVTSQNESVEELDEAVSQDTYDMHHKRAMKAVEDIAKHLMKHKANCDKSNSKWAHSDGLWMVKDLSRQLEDTAHNLAATNERTAEMNSPVVDRG